MFNKSSLSFGFFALLCSVNVRPKKHLGQHFLLDMSVCERIAEAITGVSETKKIVEVGPGTGALTQFLMKLPYETSVVEVDDESVAYLNAYYPALRGRIYEEDFLRMDLKERFGDNFCVVGNFPYNISSQILFKVLDEWECVPELVGMFQKEVAERVASGPGSRDYGILSVLLQVHYEIKYLFTVEPEVFNPPPKVKSGVLRMQRRPAPLVTSQQKEFKQVVKLAFNQRRKTIRNSVKSLLQPGITSENDLFNKRPEQLSVEQFIELTHILFPNK
ncbi:MAG: Ribosomal small subunit methyltransferase [Bacteroidota bacterium]|jgi:16S rRNA (adenine1518-N6/adenine1519-N6)-dimethyltransferase